VVFCLFCILIPLAAGLASMLRFMAGMVPVTVTLATLLGRNRAVFAISLLGLIVSAWFVTLAWLGGNVALV
jgi:ABC-type multidrug transport system permease subunit